MEFFAGDFSRIGIRLSYRFSPLKNKKTPKLKASEFLHGDPYENRTRVFAVKGQCLNLLTNGPYGSGSRSRTYDLPGMNRTLWPTELCRHIAVPFWNAIRFYQPEVTLSSKILACLKSGKERKRRSSLPEDRRFWALRGIVFAFERSGYSVS